MLMDGTPSIPPGNAGSGTPADRPLPGLISAVVPVFNEADGVALLAGRLRPVLQKCAEKYEIVFVDDGSQDSTVEAIRKLRDADQAIRAIAFSRNFGKEIAIAAGLDHARGDVVVILDADLQHPPEMIETFLARWREGFDNVYGVRTSRDVDSPLRRWLTQRFYKLYDAFGETKLPEGAGDFRLLDRKAVDALRLLGERARFNKGLYAWIGFRSTGVAFEVGERAVGGSRFNFRKLTRFALDGLMSFSTLPLRVWTYVGSLISIVSLVIGFYFFLQPLLHGVDVPGFATIIVSVMLLSGVQLMSLGILGEYIGRIFAEVKRRPLYIVDERIGMDSAQPRPEGLDERRRAP